MSIIVSRSIHLLAMAVAVVFAGAGPVRAQTSTPASAPPPVAVEGGLGYAGFIDESMVDHLTVHGAVRLWLSPRFAVGPELVYMRGPGTDRDLAIQGTAWLDLVRDDRTRRVIPYLVVSGGLTRQTVRFASGPYSSTEGAFSGGGGARIYVTRQIFIAPEARLGWEPLTRISFSVGFRR